MDICIDGNGKSNNGKIDNDSNKPLITATTSQKENDVLIDTILTIYDEVQGIFGYRMMQLHVNRRLSTHYNVKRIYRLMKLLGLKSVTRVKKKRYRYYSAEHTAQNLLDRNFMARQRNQKWLTDVTEFKYGTGEKAWLSAILDLYDRTIVAWVLGRSNNNELVFQTLKTALAHNPDVTPMIHSDRGFQYTSYGFARLLKLQGMTSSMSRVGKCIDNGPMEGFWGILKSEKYYLKKRYETYEELECDIADYMDFYNNRRLQRKLKCLTPMEFRRLSPTVAS